ncbi:hypothetical protein AYK26_01100 [Euryarchaeota archaeon SM23-78]|nr:MAG: hypothetical protein AYK26_01100 [Euryarchaeota archaeon SM23-78]MBW3001229.1 hypothetical protein [Candidatus Woesearchaeota archaeon]
MALPITRWIARNIVRRGDRHYDTARRKYGEYIVSLWLFESKAAFDEANAKGLYPRNRQINLPSYANLSSNALGYPRTFEEFRRALQPYEGTGEVRAIFLGIKDIVYFGEPETFIVNQNGFFTAQAFQYYYPNVPEGPVLALGAADLTTKFDKHGIKRIRNQIRSGLLASGAGRLQTDLEQLRWKYHPITFQAQFGDLRGRVVDKATLNPEEAPRPPHWNNNQALQWAQLVYEGGTGTGLDGHDVSLTFTIPGINGDHTINATTQIIENINGRFEFPGVPMNEDLQIRSPGQDGYNQARLEFPDPLPQLSGATQTALHNVILSKQQRGQGEERLVIIPTQEEPNNGHNNPLQQPFGPLRIPRIIFDATTRALNLTLTFKIAQASNIPRPGRAPPDRYYHVFFMENPGRIIDYNRLTNQYNIRNIQMTFKHGTRHPTVNYDNHYSGHTRFWVHQGTTIDITADFNVPDTGRVQYSIAVAFVSVQTREHRPNDQARLDRIMYALATTGNQRYAGFLRRHGVLDFNLIPIILQYSTPRRPRAAAPPGGTP